MNKFISAFICLTLLLFSCKKDESLPNCGTVVTVSENNMTDFTGGSYSILVQFGKVQKWYFSYKKYTVGDIYCL